MELGEYFQRIYIINLPERTDRRQEMEAQLSSVGLGKTSSPVQFFQAIRPVDAGEFPTIGTRGCFLSHLGVLKDAMQHGFARILILEDDLNFSTDFKDRIQGVVDVLSEKPWGMFYGGYSSLPVGSDEYGLVCIPSSQGVQTSHFIGVNTSALPALTAYLEKMLQRPGGDPLGGPMHVDGAYSWFRKEHPDVLTLAVVPELGYQRSSRTDIHDLQWHDRLPLVKDGVALLRRVRNALR